MANVTADVLQKIESLPARDQEALGRFLNDHFHEMLDEARWEALMCRSPGTLDELAAEVDEAIAHGEVAELNPDEL